MLVLKIIKKKKYIKYNHYCILTKLEAEVKAFELQTKDIESLRDGLVQYFQKN